MLPVWEEECLSCPCAAFVLITQKACRTARLCWNCPSSEPSKTNHSLLRCFFNVDSNTHAFDHTIFGGLCFTYESVSSEVSWKKCFLSTHVVSVVSTILYLAHSVHLTWNASVDPAPCGRLVAGWGKDSGIISCRSVLFMLGLSLSSQIGVKSDVKHY